MRRKAAINDTDRVFSKSSVGYMRDGDSPNSATSTPGHVVMGTGGFGGGTGTSSAAGSVRGGNAAGSGGDKKKTIKKTSQADQQEDERPATKRQKITYGSRKDD